MCKNSFLTPILIIGLITVLFAACDKDFDELGTNIVGDDHFGFDLDTTSVMVRSYNQPLGAISSNNLPVNPLGFYNNPAFGETQSNFVTQVVMDASSVNRTFNNDNVTTPESYQIAPVVDSVILNIPYFKTLKSTDSDGKNTYELDSIYPGDNQSKFQLSIYQSNFYLRDLDPDQGLAEQQMFYTNQDAEIDANKINTKLNDTIASAENTQFFFDHREQVTTKFDTDGTTVIRTRSVPSMRLHLNRSYFYNLIINAPTGKLADNATFKNYFRGLYFKTEKISGSDGNMAMLNFAGGTITMYYKEDVKTGTGSTATYKRTNKTFVLNLTGNSVSLQNTLSVTNAAYNSAISNPNYATQEASRLYLKGGAGAMAVIDLFNPADAYKYIVKVNSDGTTATDADGDPLYIKTYSPNGVSDELDDLRYPAVDVSGIDRSPKKRWMINEVNLIFYEDISAMGTAPEPNRFYLYDLNNKRGIVDYLYDASSNGLYPKFNKYVYDGIINRTQVSKGKIKYKIRITNHVRNLIKNDSTNVRLGLTITENINNVAMSKVKNPSNPAVVKAPSMSVMNPLGTIIYGTNIPAGTQGYDKRIKLEIYYTKPKN